MFFLLRMAFWLGIVLILLPSGSSQRPPSANDVGATDAISAASATVHDLRGFCARQPDACSVGSQMGIQIGYKMQAGARMLYDFLTEKLGAHDSGSIAIVTDPHGAGKSAFGKSWTLRGSQNTLTPADLAPAWRGPSARKDAKPAA
jgi:hypothetical protein